MEKGFKTLELIGDLDDKYIYEASKPWKKQHRFFHIQRSWKTAVAGIILLIMVGCTLRYQEDVMLLLHLPDILLCKSSITESNFMDRTGIGN